MVKNIIKMEMQMPSITTSELYKLMMKEGLGSEIPRIFVPCFDTGKQIVHNPIEWVKRWWDRDWKHVLDKKLHIQEQREIDETQRNHVLFTGVMNELRIVTSNLWQHAHTTQSIMQSVRERKSSRITQSFIRKAHTELQSNLQYAPFCEELHSDREILMKFWKFEHHQYDVTSYRQKLLLNENMMFKTFISRWYRKPESVKIKWSPELHQYFPDRIQENIRITLLAMRRTGVRIDPLMLEMDVFGQLTMEQRCCGCEGPISWCHCVEVAGYDVDFSSLDEDPDQDYFHDLATEVDFVPDYEAENEHLDNEEH